MKGVFFISIICMFSSCQKERRKNYNHLYPGLVGEWKWVGSDWYWKDQLGLFARSVSADSVGYEATLQLLENGEINFALDGEMIFTDKLRIRNEIPVQSLPLNFGTFPLWYSLYLDLEGDESLIIKHYNDAVFTDTIVLDKFPFATDENQTGFSLNVLHITQSNGNVFDMVDNYFIKVQ